MLVEFRSQLVVFDVLETGQPIGQRSHVAAALDVVLAAERVDAAPVATDMAGQQHEIDEGEDVVDGVMVLGDAESPADHRPWCRREGVGELADRVGGDAGLALGIVQGVALDLGLISVVAVGRPLDKFLVLETRRDDLAPDRVGEGDVAADVEAQPDIGPFGRGRPPRIDRVEPSALADTAKEVMEEDRVRLAGVAAPQDDQVRVFGLTV